MATPANRFDASFQALMYDHPKQLFWYIYCVIFMALSILNEASAFVGLKERDLFLELLFSSAIFAGVVHYGSRRREEKRRVAHLAGD